MSDYKLGYECGLALGCAVHGISAAALRKKASLAHTCANDLTFQKAIAKVAETIFTKSGEEFEKSAAIYNAIANSPEPLSTPTQEMFLTPVLETLAKAARQDEFVKESSFGLGSITGPIKDIISSAGSLVGGAQEGLYRLALLGLIGGGAGGVLANVASRHMREDSAKAEAKREQAKHYRRIAEDLQKRIDAKAEPSKLRKKIEDEEEGDYVL